MASHQWQSNLENHPEHVNAIGMISIENANLEIELANLLSATLFLPIKVAHAIYFAPRASAVRIQILKDAAKARLTWPKKRQASGLGKQMAEALQKVEKLTSRSLGVIGRRHEIIHNSWAVSEEGVCRQDPSEWPGKEYTLTPIQSLKDLLTDFRLLIDEVGDLAKEFNRHPPIMADMKLATKSGSSAREVREGKASSRKN